MRRLLALFCLFTVTLVVGVACASHGKPNCHIDSLPPFILTETVTETVTETPPPPETYGPRGAVGQRLSSDIPGFPMAFRETIAPGPGTIQAAVAANPPGAVFRLLPGTYCLTSTVEPKAGQELWGEDGVMIANGAALANAIRPSGDAPNVKVMNLVFTGFIQQIDGSNNDGWEIGYNEFLDTSFGTKLGSAKGAVVHHSVFNYIAGAIGAFQSRNVTFRNNQFGPVIGNSGSDGGQKLVGTRGFTFAHNHCDGGIRGCIWLDTSNSEALIEWNLIENTGSASPMGAISMEQNCWIDGTETDPDQAQPMSEATKNVVRYNLIRNNYSSAIHILHSCWTEVYGNTLENNLRNPGFAEIYLAFANPTPMLAGFQFHVDLANNSIHDNTITQVDATRKVVQLVVDNVTATPFVTNAKANTFDFNVYEFAAGAAAFAWGGDKTFPQWQAIPQDANGRLAE